MKLGMLVPALAAVLLTGSASAQYYGQTKLEVGSEAPKLTIKEWVKGDKVEAFEEGHVYVIEFWATW